MKLLLMLPLIFLACPPARSFHEKRVTTVQWKAPQEETVAIDPMRPLLLLSF